MKKKYLGSSYKKAIIKCPQVTDILESALFQSDIFVFSIYL